jgi:hypothetical protein
MLIVLVIIRDKAVLYVGDKEKLLISIKWKMIILNFCDEVVTNNKRFVFVVVLILSNHVDYCDGDSE